MKNKIRAKINEIYQKYLNSVKKWNNPQELLKSKIDPTSFMITQHFRNKTFKEAIALEINRKIDKSIQNSLGKFYEDILNFFPNCHKPTKGLFKSFDLIYLKDDKIKIVAEIKNKYNTTNSDSATKIYEKMLKVVKNNENIICYLVEVIAKESKDEKWIKSFNGKTHKHERIRIISIDRFIKLISDKWSFKRLWDFIVSTIKGIGKENYNIEVIKQNINHYNINVILNSSFKNYLEFY